MYSNTLNSALPPRCIVEQPCQCKADVEEGSDEAHVPAVFTVKVNGDLGVH